MVFPQSTRAQLPSRALFNPASFKILQDRFELLRRDGEIKKPIPARAAFSIDLIEAFRQTLVACRIVEFALMIENGLGEAVPDFVAHCLSRILPRSPLPVPCGIPRPFLGGGRNRPLSRRRQFAIGRDVVERRNEFAMRQITGRAENHNGARSAEPCGYVRPSRSGLGCGWSLLGFMPRGIIAD